MPVALADIAPTPTRLCPKCGVTTTDTICGADTTATIDLHAFETANWQLSLGQIVNGKYRILGEIARGGHGTVYRADHLLGLGTVALKLPGRGAMDVVDLRRFFREAQVSARLTGAHTARVFDVGQTDDGALYLAMEFVDGPTLETVLRHLRDSHQVMTEGEAARIAIDVLAGLEDAHAAGLVHRDLKPSNIAMRRSDGSVKILDFGLALVHDSSLTPSERAMGTPHYMSPEQCEGGEVDGRADLYALGVVLYRMITGSLPFVGDGTMAVLWGHVHRPVPDVASHAQAPVSPAFVQVIMRALAKRPDRRFANATEMREALRRLVAEASDGSVGSAVTSDFADLPLGQPSGVATASASGVLLAKPPTRVNRRRVAAWAFAGACLAVAALAAQTGNRTPSVAAPVVHNADPIIPSPQPAQTPPTPQRSVVVAEPEATTPTVQVAALASVPGAPRRPTHHRSGTRAPGRDAAAPPDWKKPLLPQ
jgi:serine/threonine-protein kinase